MKLFNTANDFGHISEPPDRGDCETCIHKREKLNGMEFEEWCVKRDCEYEEKEDES